MLITCWPGSPAIPSFHFSSTSPEHSFIANRPRSEGKNARREQILLHSWDLNKKSGTDAQTHVTNCSKSKVNPASSRLQKLSSETTRQITDHSDYYITLRRTKSQTTARSPQPFLHVQTPCVPPAAKLELTEATWRNQLGTPRPERSGMCVPQKPEPAKVMCTARKPNIKCTLDALKF